MKETKKYANTTAKTKELHLTAKSQRFAPHLLLSQAYLPPPKLNDFLAKNFGKQKTLAKFDTYSQ